MASQEFKYVVTVRAEIADEDAAAEMQLSIDDPEVAEATTYALSEALEHFQRVGFPRETDVGEALSFTIDSVHSQPAQRA